MGVAGLVVVTARFLGEPLEQITVLFTVKVLSHAVLAAKGDRVGAEVISIATGASSTAGAAAGARASARVSMYFGYIRPGMGSIKGGGVCALLQRVRAESYSFLPAIRKHDARFDLGIGGGQVNQIADFGAQLDVAVVVENRARS